jgi:hypothetical protein
MAKRTYIVTVDVSGDDVVMPTRIVQRAIEDRMTGDGFTGHVTVVPAGCRAIVNTGSNPEGGAE